MNSVEQLKKVADNVRILSVSMVEKAKSGHPGGAMGGADFVTVLFSEFLEYDPNNPYYSARDRFFMDPGHMSPMLYSILACTGRYSMDDLKQFRQWGSVTPGHPEVDVVRGVENTSGPLGQGHTFAVGAAIAAKFLNAKFEGQMNQTIYAYISDGGIQEEISQGAGRIAGHLGLNNLVMFYDSNNIQLSTSVDEVSTENVAMKYKAWGWNVIEINGNDIDAIRKALRDAKQENNKPTLIIGKTIMGLGARKADGSSYENDCATHGAPLGGDAYTNTITNLGAACNDPFQLFDVTKEVFENRKLELINLMQHKLEKSRAWQNENPELAKKMETFFSKKAPVIDWSQLEQKPNQATRAASAACLGLLAQQVENMIVSSADLSNSDKTDGFLKHTHAMQNGDFTGAFLQAGVSELTMACLCIGMALHGGVIAACATFFVFSDYMKPAIRMAALMELPVKFIWSHDAFRVGEDGPTHEPVEQEAQIRLMEKLQNHSGHNSMLVLRPADVFETTVCYELAMNNINTPSALILSRQNIKDLPGDNKIMAQKATRGAYVVTTDENPQVVLIASGSEVSTLCDSADILRQKGYKIRVVSVPSEGLFRSQSKEYQDEVLPLNVKRFGLTAGLPINLLGLVGTDGEIFGLNSFGFSAPYTILDEKLGFTPEQVAVKVENMIK